MEKKKNNINTSYYFYRTYIILLMQSIVPVFCYEFECYSHNENNKISGGKKPDFYMTIPQGDKCFAWFQKDSCHVIDAFTKKNLHVFKNIGLVMDTLVAGTLFRIKNSKDSFFYFNVEDIVIYQNKNIQQGKWTHKLSILSDLFEKDGLGSLLQNENNENNIQFGLPIFKTNLEEIMKEGDMLPYPLDKIQPMFLTTDQKTKPTINTNTTNTNTIQNKNNKKQNKHYDNNKCSIFEVRPEIQNDIYGLYILSKDENIPVFYQHALIPNYKTSVLMNRLFRNIKENANLDTLEESDSEEEFENQNADKFVDLNKSYLMVCQYNSHFNKWFPVRLAEQYEKI